MITNVCPRCHDEKVVSHKDAKGMPTGFFGCQECGKAMKGYELMLKVQLEGEDKPRFIRNVMREMAGTLSEYTAPNLAAGLARVLELYKTSVTPAVAREIISRTVSEAFQTMYQMTTPFLPPETQEAVQLLSDLVMKDQESVQRKEKEEHGEGERGAAEGEVAGGEAGVTGG